MIILKLKTEQSPITESKTGQFCPKIGLFGHFWANLGLAESFGVLLVGWLVVGFWAQATLTVERRPASLYLPFPKIFVKLGKFPPPHIKLG